MANYDITQLQSLEHDTVKGRYNSLVMIDSTHFILAYAGDGDDGYIKTFSINGSYEIAEIDSFIHDGVSGVGNSLVMIDSTHFILAYRGSGAHGYIKTFSIDGNYDNIAQLEVLEYDGVYAYENSLVIIDSTHFILAHMGTGQDGFIRTFSINGSYEIAEIDSLVHDGVTGRYNSLVKIDSTHFILAYQGDGQDGYIKTFSIDGNYDNITEIDVLEHEIADAYDNSLVKIDGTHFILAYAGVDTDAGSTYDGYIKTFYVGAPLIATRRRASFITFF